MSNKHPPLRQLDYLDHMLEAIRLACSYIVIEHVKVGDLSEA